MSGSWTFGIFHCFGDMRECCYSCCCFSCAYADMRKEAFDESYAKNCLAQCCLGPCAGGTVGACMGMDSRERMKEKYGINQENWLRAGGFLEWFFCRGCALVQQRRELKLRRQKKEPDYSPLVQTVPQATASMQMQPVKKGNATTRTGDVKVYRSPSMDSCESLEYDA